MRTSLNSLFLIAAAVGLLGARSAESADLRKADRSIAKEPAYRTTAPRYALLVFGPEARSRVWLVQDGDLLYVDRNGNSDLTEKDERLEVKQKEETFRIFEAGDLRDGTLTHTGLSVTQIRVTPEIAGSPQELERTKGTDGEAWHWTVNVSAERPADDQRALPRHIKYVVNGDGLGFLVFAGRPQDAPVIHFNGPWTLGLQDFRDRFTAGHESELQIGVGTQGIGPGTFSFVLYPDTIPPEAHPVAEITFPPKSPDGKPITGKFTLTDRC
jgi:hypothetical protein